MPRPNSESEASTSDIASRKTRLLALQGAGELAEEGRADADDDGEHHHLDARGDDIAEHALGQERRLVPQREGHQHKAGQRRQLEFEDGDEELNRQDEEGEHDDEPGEQQHEDRHKMGEKGGEAHQRAGLLQQRPRRLKAGARELARPQQIGGRQAAAWWRQARASRRN